MKIYLVRHGKPIIRNCDFFKCHLGKEGIASTREFASSGKIPKPNLIFSSPYNRAIDTAKVFSEVFSLDYELVDSLKEWNLQSLNLPDPEYAVQEELGWTTHEKIVMGDESLDDVKRRISQGIKNLVLKHGGPDCILLVSHGTVIDMFCSVVSGRKAKLSDIKGMKHLDYAIVEYSNNKFVLIKDIIKSC